jgi:small-conductance mechanosensitive channel
MGLVSGAPALAQAPALPGVPGGPTRPAEAPGPTAINAPTDDNPEATAAEATGTITVDRQVTDAQIAAKLERLLPRYPGVRQVGVQVEEGVVTLTGHVSDPEARDRLREFVRRVEGVTLVLNRVRTDAQTLSARQYTLQRLREYADLFARRWLLVVVALAILVAAVLVARLFRRSGDRLMALLSPNAMLRAVLSSVVTLGILAGGVLLALNLLGLTQGVLSFLGLAGVAALAVGFAFRDIAENFIASVMLGVRRPYRLGDFVEVAGKSGVVMTLNTRATVLVTLDGSQVRIPNAIMFKEILVNRTASKSARASFDILIPWEASTAQAMEAITRALRQHEGFESEPAPRTLVEAIEPAGVRLRAYFWFPTGRADRLKLLSDAQLAAKVALQDLGVRPPLNSVQILRGDPAVLGPRNPDIPSDSEQANRSQDRIAADIASEQRPEDQEDEIEHALEIAGEAVGDEGKNLIVDPPGRSRSAGEPARGKTGSS